MSSDTQTQPHTELIVDVGPVAHGGHCVARHEGRVVFVRHGIPGEKVRVRLTESGPDAKFWRGDVVEVLEPSPDRVEHFWDLADSVRSWSHRPPAGGRRRTRPHLPGAPAQPQGRGAGRTAAPAGRRRPPAGAGTNRRGRRGSRGGARTRRGGGPRLAHPRRLRRDPGRKARHARAPLRHRPPGPGDAPGRRTPSTRSGSGTSTCRASSAWRSPPRPTAPARSCSWSRPREPGPSGSARSSPSCPRTSRWPASIRSRARCCGCAGAPTCRRPPSGHDFRVTGDGFWQIHRDGPDTLVGAVTGFLHDGGFLEPGAVVADLYAGAGLFTAPLADAVGVTGSVLSVEGSPGTSRDARKNLHDATQVEIVQGRVERVLREKARTLRRHPAGPAPGRCRQGRRRTSWSGPVPGPSPMCPAIRRPLPAMWATSSRPAGNWRGCGPLTCIRTPTTWRLWRC